MTPRREREIHLMELVQRLANDDTRRTASAEILLEMGTLAADENERATMHEINMLLKMLTRQLTDQKGPVAVAILELIADAARLHKTEHLMTALPHVANSLLKALATYDGRVHRACAAVFGTFAACLAWPVSLRSDDHAPVWQGVQLSPLLGPLMAVLSSSVKEQQVGACTCLVEIVSMAPTPLLLNALSALVGKCISLLRMRQTLVVAPLLGALRALAHVAGEAFEPHAERVLAEAVALAKERRLLVETDDWHVKKAAAELAAGLACQFAYLLPCKEDGEFNENDAAESPAQPTATSTPGSIAMRTVAPVSRESLYRLLGRLRTDPAKPVRESVLDALAALKVHCPLPETASAPQSAERAPRKSGTPVSLRRAKEEAATAAAEAKENDGVLIISPGNPSRPTSARPPAVSPAPLTAEPTLTPTISPARFGGPRTLFGEHNDFGASNAPHPPADKSLAKKESVLAPAAFVFDDGAQSEQPNAEELAPPLLAEAAAATEQADAMEKSVSEVPVSGNFARAEQLGRTPAKPPTPSTAAATTAAAAADDWKKELSLQLDELAPSAELAAAPAPAIASAPKARTGLRLPLLLLAAALAAAALQLSGPHASLLGARTPIFIAVGRAEVGAVSCVLRTELGGVAVEHCGTLPPAAEHAVVEEVVVAAEPEPRSPTFGMPEGATVDLAGGVAVCEANGESACIIVGWTLPAAAAPPAAAPVAPAASAGGLGAFGKLFALLAMVAGVAWAARAHTAKPARGADLGSFVEYDSALRSPVRRSRRLSGIKAPLGSPAQSPGPLLAPSPAQHIPTSARKLVLA
ncbi:hypothetical protein T492DRAFT_1080560 [Pavlovales sp. CCMP2436]|nr:hypothetical protein T492DRAFT_1080560 [Pavlovales sp. CCMP2436]